MIATRALRPGFILTLALATSFGSANFALAQATKADMKTKVAKEKVKEKEKVASIDLNSATSAELQTLPGVGEATARKIIDSRPHKAVTDLAGAGVSASEIEKLKPLVEVKALPAAVDVNNDSVDKLETLPGVGPAIAKEIVVGRPHADYESIAKLKGIGPEKLDALKGRLKFGEDPVAAIKAKAKAKADDVTGAVKKEMVKVDEKAKAKANETAKKVEEATAPKPKLAPGTKININTADKEVLDELPGIGPVKAQAILDARASKKFEKIEDIMTVKGIKEGEFAKIKDIITVK